MDEEVLSADAARNLRRAVCERDRSKLVQECVDKAFDRVRATAEKGEGYLRFRYINNSTAAMVADALEQQRYKISWHPGSDVSFEVRW